MDKRNEEVLDHHVLIHVRSGKTSAGVIWQNEARARRIVDVEKSLHRLRRAGLVDYDVATGWEATDATP